MDTRKEKNEQNKQNFPVEETEGRLSRALICAGHFS